MGVARDQGVEICNLSKVKLVWAWAVPIVPDKGAIGPRVRARARPAQSDNERDVMSMRIQSGLWVNDPNILKI